MLAARKDDGRGVPYTLTWGDGPGEYRPTPPEFPEFPASWVAKVKPFLAESADYYRTEGPYALTSAEYAKDYNEVKTLGALEGSSRTPEQEALTKFWISPIGQWSQVERALATEKGLDITEAARLFAMANLAAADTSSAIWTDKYHWKFWRPITAIAEAESDGNPDTAADPNWQPLGGPTPPYPDHPSGFNGIAGAHVGALQQFFGTDDMAYQIEQPGHPGTPQLHLVQPGAAGGHRPAGPPGPPLPQRGRAGSGVGPEGCGTRRGAAGTREVGRARHRSSSSSIRGHWGGPVSLSGAAGPRRCRGPPGRRASGSAGPRPGRRRRP